MPEPIGISAQPTESPPPTRHHDSMAELREILADPDRRRRFLDILGIVSLLGGCVIDRDFRVADQWTEPITFTPLGLKIVGAVGEKQKRLKPNEVKLAVFMSFGCAEGMLVTAEADVDALRSQLSKDVLKGKILYPYIFGRDLHDRAAELFPEKTSLTIEQTIRLLRGLPVGVFQVGRSLVGPYGCLVSRGSRYLAPERDVPGYHCAIETCRAVHKIHLSTGESAVHRARNAVRLYIQEHHSEKTDLHPRLIHDAMQEDYDGYAQTSSAALVDTLVDGLTAQELRSLADRLLRRSFRDPEARSALSRQIQTVIGNPTDLVQSLDPARLVQIVLLHQDADIISTVDAVVADGTLPLREYETRLRKVLRWNDGPSAEIGALGLRFTGAAGSGFVVSRLLELLHRLFFASDILAPDDLAYALDAPRPVDEDELLGRAVQVLSPERILRELVIGNRLAAVEAGSFLGVENAGELGREDLLGRLLWKLGVPSSVIFGDLLRVAKYEGELAASSKAGAPSDTVRGHISNLFAAVEDALQRALEYITWSLTTDHFMEEGGFRYDPDPSPDVFQFIDEHSPMSDPALRLRGDGKNTIVPLAAGFARLAKGLKATSFDEYTRRRDLVPHICRVTGRPFVFAYTLPFLALTEGSRDSVLSDLHAIGQYIQDPNVVKVRNAGIHGNNQFPTAEELKSAVENIHLCRLRLRSTGVYPTVFNLVATEVDAFGRAISRYRGEVDEVVLQTPQWAVAPSLPSKLPQLLVIPAARMMSVGPMRFRLNPRGRNDPYWDGWPKRWRTDNSYESGDREVDLNEVSDVAG